MAEPAPGVAPELPHLDAPAPVHEIELPDDLKDEDDFLELARVLLIGYADSIGSIVTRRLAINCTWPWPMMPGPNRHNCWMGGDMVNSGTRRAYPYKDLVLDVASRMAEITGTTRDLVTRCAPEQGALYLGQDRGAPRPAHDSGQFYIGDLPYDPALNSWFVAFLDLYGAVIRDWADWCWFTMCSEINRCARSGSMDDERCVAAAGAAMTGAKSRAERWLRSEFDRWWNWMTVDRRELPVEIEAVRRMATSPTFMRSLRAQWSHNLSANRQTVPTIGDLYTLGDAAVAVWYLPPVRGRAGAVWHLSPSGVNPNTLAVGLQAGIDPRTGRESVYVYVPVRYRGRNLWYAVNLQDWPSEPEVVEGILVGAPTFPTRAIPSGEGVPGGIAPGGEVLGPGGGGGGAALPLLAGAALLAAVLSS